MTTNAKLLVGAMGFLAVAATPAAAATKTHHVRPYHSHIVRVAPPYEDWQGAYAYQPRRDPVTAHAAYDGFQRDRQMVGIGY
jgi:hypothetical protein